MSFGDDLDRQRGEVMQAVDEARDSWASAMRAHRLAPPDVGFAARLRDLADAAAAEQAAWESARNAGVAWQPVADAEGAQPPYELRPGTGRRGPEELWSRFDSAVASLNRAISGSEASEVARAFGELARVADMLADAVAQEDDVGAIPAARARGAA